jgi:tetratricopeptide (TPR) repeat protein
VPSVAFDDPAARRTARRTGAVAAIGLLWVALLASLGLPWVARAVAAATLIGVVVLLAPAGRARFDVPALGAAARRRVASVATATARLAGRAAAGARVVARRSLGSLRRAAARASAVCRRGAAEAAASAHDVARALPLRRPRSTAPAGPRLAHESVVLRREGQVDEALRLAHEAVVAYHATGDRRGEALAMNTLALTLAQAGRYAEAVGALDGSLTLLGELGERHREGTVLVNLGTLHRRAGGVESARYCWLKALERLDPASPESQQAERLLRAS